MNIVFDVGNVLLAWDPAQLLAQHLPDPAQRAAAHAGLVSHPDWHELDRGTLPYPEAIARAAARTGLPHTSIEAILRGVHQALTPIPASLDLVARLQAAGHPTYVLSNMPHWATDAIERDYDFWPGFDAVLFSCRIQRIKPEPDIFDYLLASQSLRPDETVFLDDLPVNIAAARAAGIHGILFHDAIQAEAELQALGCTCRRSA